MAPAQYLSFSTVSLASCLVLSLISGAESFAAPQVGRVSFAQLRSAASRKSERPAAVGLDDGDDSRDGPSIAAVPTRGDISPPAVSSRRGAMTAIASGLCSSLFMTCGAKEASAGNGRVIGQISGSGLVFKDTVVVETFEDPKVKGITLYVSNFERPLAERLQKDFFTDPSSASVTCVRTQKVIEVADNINKEKTGEPVFEEKKSLLFKELRVQRVYDAEKNTVVYVSFNTRLDKNSDTNKSRFKSSICAINLD